MARIVQPPQHGGSGTVDVMVGIVSVGYRATAIALRPPLAAGVIGARLARRLPPVDALAALLAAEGREARDRAIHDVQRAGDALVASGVIDSLARQLLGSDLVVAVVDQVLASPEMQRTVERFASSPELRGAIAEQSAGVAKEVVGGVRRASVRLDDASEQTVRRWLRRPRPSTA